jgi:hypothetical protein
MLLVVARSGSSGKLNRWQAGPLSLSRNHEAVSSDVSVGCGGCVHVLGWGNICKEGVEVSTSTPSVYIEIGQMGSWGDKGLQGELQLQ